MCVMDAATRSQCILHRLLQQQALQVELSRSNQHWPMWHWRWRDCIYSSSSVCFICIFCTIWPSAASFYRFGSFEKYSQSHKPLLILCTECTALIVYLFSKSIQATQICNQRAHFSHSFYSLSANFAFFISLFFQSRVVKSSYSVSFHLNVGRCFILHGICLCVFGVRQINRAKRKKKLHKIANLVFYTLDISTTYAQSSIGILSLELSLFLSFSSSFLSLSFALSVLFRPIPPLFLFLSIALALTLTLSHFCLLSPPFCFQLIQCRPILYFADFCSLSFEIFHLKSHLVETSKWNGPIAISTIRLHWVSESE